ncbi:MAG: cysteine desulfurase [Verrucomicrobiota bacterium]|nr:cysteine desulfurase [Verrucomicrobiota bacterium]
MRKIFLDNNSTTALDPRVLQAVVEELQAPPANPSSTHWFGMRAKERLRKAREECAAFFQVPPEEILFTSSGTESINLMLRGLSRKGHLVTTEIEHAAVEETVRGLEKEGMSVTWLSVGSFGAPLPESIEAALRADTQAIVLSLAGGETGVRIDLEAIAALAEKKKIPLLLDGVAYIGREKFSLFPAMQAIAVSGHKFHAPKGVGILVHRKDFPIAPLLTGGGQEYRLRSGTENLPGIVGMARALQILGEKQEEIRQKILHLRLHFEKELTRALPDLLINGEGPRISNTSNIAFSGVDGETLLIQLDLAGIAASHGSACSSGALEPSRILLRMGLERKRCRSSVRFSFARTNTKEEVDRSLEIIVRLVKDLR